MTLAGVRTDRENTLLNAFQQPSEGVVTSVPEAYLIGTGGLAKSLVSAAVDAGKAGLGIGTKTTPDFVWHATANSRAAQGVLNGIDPIYLNPNSRFGPAFYVAEQPGTTIAELAHHGVDATHGIRFELDASTMNVLDLTNANIARMWSYSGGPISSITQAIGIRAQEQGFNVIRFYSERANGGINSAIFDNFNDILRPVAISPVKP